MKSVTGISSRKLEELAGQFLEEYKEVLSRNICNDWDWPETWTEEEINAVRRALHVWNNSEEPYDAEEWDRVPDWCMAAFLGSLFIPKD